MPNEAKLQLAKQAIEKGKITSNRDAAIQYNVNRETLRRRRNGVSSKQDSTVHSMLLLDLEEEIIVNRVLDLDARGFPPNLRHVREMANSILAARSNKKAGMN